LTSSEERDAGIISSNYILFDVEYSGDSKKITCFAGESIPDPGTPEV